MKLYKQNPYNKITVWQHRKHNPYNMSYLYDEGDLTDLCEKLPLQYETAKSLINLIRKAFSE